METESRSWTYLLPRMALSELAATAVSPSQHSVSESISRGRAAGGDTLGTRDPANWSSYRQGVLPSGSRFSSAVCHCARRLQMKDSAVAALEHGAMPLAATTHARCEEGCCQHSALRCRGFRIELRKHRRDFLPSSQKVRRTPGGFVKHRWCEAKIAGKMMRKFGSNPSVRGYSSAGRARRSQRRGRRFDPD